MGGGSAKVEVAKRLGGCEQGKWGGGSLAKHIHDPSTGQAEARGLPPVLGQAELCRETLTPKDIPLSPQS